MLIERHAHDGQKVPVRQRLHRIARTRPIDYDVGRAAAAVCDVDGAVWGDRNVDGKVIVVDERQRRGLRAFRINEDALAVRVRDVHVAGLIHGDALRRGEVALERAGNRVVRAASLEVIVDRVATVGRAIDQALRFNRLRQHGRPGRSLFDLSRRLDFSGSRKGAPRAK